jgi:hypothetical protein
MKHHGIHLHYIITLYKSSAVNFLHEGTTFPKVTLLKFLFNTVSTDLTGVSLFLWNGITSKPKKKSPNLPTTYVNKNSHNISVSTE